MQSRVEGADVLSGGRAAVLRLGELQSALSEERVLIEDLGQVLLRQREGVAADDQEVVEATVRSRYGDQPGRPQPGARGW